MTGSNIAGGGDNKTREYRRESVLRELYEERGLSIHRVADRLGVSHSTVGYWLDKNGIETRSSGDHNRGPGADYHMNRNGHMYFRVWDSESESSQRTPVHRLQAVAEYGIEAVSPDSDVHHKNGIPWDNRPSNLEVLSRSEHQEKHSHISEPERLAMVALYDATEMSSREVANIFGVSHSRVLRLHKKKLTNGGDS